MKFLCLGAADPSKCGVLPMEERLALIEKCFAYDDELRTGGHWVQGFALETPNEAVTIRMRGGKVDVSDGPYAETKEFLGGILVLEAKDLNQAIALVSKHPGLGMGPFEIRPIDIEMTEMIDARVAKAKANK